MQVRLRGDLKVDGGPDAADPPPTTCVEKAMASMLSPDAAGSLGTHKALAKFQLDDEVLFLHVVKHGLNNDAERSVVLSMLVLALLLDGGAPQVGLLAKAIKAAGVTTRVDWRSQLARVGKLMHDGEVVTADDLLDCTGLNPTPTPLTWRQAAGLRFDRFVDAIAIF